MTVDLNADVGESSGEDPLYALVTSVNVACGGHAGDPAAMTRAVRLASLHGVAVGAHPSYPDRAGFGRHSMAIPLDDLTRALRDQIEALSTICATAGIPLGHVKPHGALYHDTRREEIASAVGDAVTCVDRRLTVIGLAGSPALATWRARGLEVAAEGFADRAYEADGSLRPRQQPGALVLDPERAAEQALRLVRGGGVDTLCVHADTPGAGSLLRAVRAALVEAGVRVAARPGPSR